MKLTTQSSFKTISPIYMNKYNFVYENIKKIRGKQKKEVLDVGCGQGEYIQLFQKASLKVKGIDINRKLIKSLPNAQYGSITNIPFKDSSFDIVNCIDVLEHVNNEKRSLHELNRVIKRGGLLILTVPNQQFPITYDPINKLLMMFDKHINIGVWYWGHKKLYPKNYLFSLLNEWGFRVIKYEQRSHILISTFVNYLPFIADKFFLKGNLQKKKKKKGIVLTLIKKIFRVLGGVDNTLFDRFSGISHCVIAIKIKNM